MPPGGASACAASQLAGAAGRPHPPAPLPAGVSARPAVEVEAEAVAVAVALLEAFGLAALVVEHLDQSGHGAQLDEVPCVLRRARRDVRERPGGFGSKLAAKLW